MVWVEYVQNQLLELVPPGTFSYIPPLIPQKPLPPKNKAIPGYAGYVPGKNSENTFGKTYSTITKKRFGDENLRANRTGLSTTG